MLPAETTEGEVAPQESEDGVSKALTEVTKTNLKITELANKGYELAERYKGVVADVRTTKGYEQIAAIRTELREEVRYPMQRLQDTGSKMLGTMQRQFNERAKELIAEALKLETPFQEQLDAEDTRKANVKAEREAAEQRRKDGHMEAVRSINELVTAGVGHDSATLEVMLANAQGVIVDNSYEEFQGQAQQAKDEAIRQLNGMLVAARAEEAKRAEVEETRRAQAAYAQEQHERAVAAEAAAAAERAKAEAAEAETAQLRLQLLEAAAREERQRAENERAQQERADAIEARIQEIHALVPKYSGEDEPATMLSMVIEALQRRELSVDFFGERTAEATKVREDVLATLSDLLQSATEREAAAAEAARQAEAAARRERQDARIQQLISAMETLGNAAMLAVQDGSADLDLLRGGLVQLEEGQILYEDYGSRMEEATKVRDAAVAATKAAIELTEARDKARAEETVRRQQQEEADRAMRERHLRLQAAAPRMFELIEVLEGIIAVQNFPRLHADLQAIIREVKEGTA